MKSDPGEGDMERSDGDGDFATATGVAVPGGDDVMVEIESSRRRVGSRLSGEDEGDIRRRLFHGVLASLFLLRGVSTIVQATVSSRGATGVVSMAESSLLPSCTPEARGVPGIDLTGESLIGLS